MNNKKIIGTTIVTAIASSLCCIVPLLAFIAGVSGAASAVSWIAPLRPYLLGFTVLVLGYAWYQKLKIRKGITCNCDEKSSFINTKKFLLVITLFAGLMATFPYYSSVFYSNTKKDVVIVNSSDIKIINYKINGMTCTACEIHIESEVNKLEGVITVKANYDKGNTYVEYDKTKLTNKDIENAILKTGYTIQK